MAFEDLLRLQAYLRGDGRNPMAEAIQQRGARQRQLEDRAQSRADVFESQRRSQEFQREEGELDRSSRETLVDKQATAYLDRLKAMQNFKLQSDFPKKEGETDDQWQERVGKEQAATINDYYQKSADARAGMETAIQEEQRRREPQARALALNALRENSDSKIKKLLEGATDITGLVEGLQKKNPKAGQQLKQQYDAILDQVRDGLLFDEKGTVIDPKLRIKLRNLESEATEWNKGARDLIDTFRSDGTFRGAPYLKLPERKTAPPPPTPEGFAPRKSPGRSSGGRPLPSMGGSTGAEATPANGPGAGASPPPQSGAPYRLPGEGFIPRGLNYLNENFEDPVLPVLGNAARALYEPVRGSVIGLGNLGRAAFTGNPQIPYQLPRAGVDMPASIAPPPGQPFGLAGVVPMPPPTDLSGSMRGFQPVVDPRTPPLAMNVSTNELHDYFLNELGMTPGQIDEHEEEKAQGNPEAIQSEQEILAQIMRRRAMPPPMEPVLMR